MRRFSVGLDFGTESARAVVVDVATGRVAGQAVAAYEHGVIDRALPIPDGRKLPPDFALQDPLDWLNAARDACREAVQAGGVPADDVAGVGVAFTSCTLLPTLKDGTPLCLMAACRPIPQAWPKLWKHHGAGAQAERINRVARERKEPWLGRYGGAISLEWFFPKVLETLVEAPDVYQSADVWVEAGDWLVWQLTSGPFPKCDPSNLVRSTCQAGYKAMWNAASGYPAREFFEAVQPGFGDVVGRRMPGTLTPPGRPAGALTERAAEILGLRTGTPVSAAVIDAHAGVPGSGVADDGTLVLVMGTSACHMVNATVERHVPGVAGVVEGGILPGYFGYETGQTSFGDAFGWLAKTVKLTHTALAQRAGKLPAGSGGVLALDWLNGCRTPLMDGRLSGAFVGVTLATRPEQLYRALLEGAAFGLRWIVETLVEAGVPVRRYVAGGGLPGKSPLLMQICADVLNAEIRLAESEQSVALGAAILGRLAAEAEPPSAEGLRETIGRMARVREDLVYRPGANAKRYGELYRLYRDLGAVDGVVAATMRRLRELED